MNIDAMIPLPMNGADMTHRGDGKTALIVDDRAEFLTLTTPWLTGLGYHILTASDGREAQGMMMEKGVTNVDLLVTDLDMPRMQGDELARWFVQENPGARVLVISGCLGDTMLPGGVVCLEKPFSRELFIARLNDLFSHSGVTAVIPASEHIYS